LQADYVCDIKHLHEIERAGYFLKLLPYALSGFDLSTHNSVGGGDTTRPRHQGKLKFFLNSSVNIELIKA
jgi:hypothetical protein